jgi:hypothetical protein
MSQRSRALPRMWAATVGAAADWSGQIMRTVPGAGGALLVSYGLWEAWHPLGFVTAGAFLLVLDRRVP